jgi:nucleotide-binding universal stress UspA family protein
MKRAEKKVLWAVDPFDQSRPPPPEVAAQLDELARRSGATLLPVHVITVLERSWETGTLPLVPEIQAAVDRYLARLRLSGAARARVLVDESGNRTGGVRALLEVAAAEGAEWIAVTSHGRAGPERLVLGSFAEMLLELSPLPVLFLPRSFATSDTRTALFPTDFSAASQAAYRQFLAVAARQRFEVVVLHALTYPIVAADYGFGPIGLGPVVPASHLREHEEWAEAAGARLVEEAAARGIRARFQLESGVVPAISGKTVLQAARREGARAIAMAHPSGPVARFVAGSVPEEVFRAGRVFAWLYGPRAVGGAGALAA